MGIATTTPSLNASSRPRCIDVSFRFADDDTSPEARRSGAGRGKERGSEEPRFLIREAAAYGCRVGTALSRVLPSGCPHRRAEGDSAALRDRQAEDRRWGTTGSRGPLLIPDWSWKKFGPIIVFWASGTTEAAGSVRADGDASRAGRERSHAEIEPIVHRVLDGRIRTLRRRRRAWGGVFRTGPVSESGRSGRAPSL